MIKVVIADDHKLVLNGIRDLLQQVEIVNLIDAVTNGEDLLRILRNQEIDVVLSDIDMPMLSGLDVLKKVEEEKISTKIILLSVHDEKAIISKAFAMGAHGFLLKRSEPELIITAIESVYNGKKFFDDEALQIALKPTLGDPDSSDMEKVALLTNREKEIINMVVEGDSNQNIADKLFVSKRTVDTHRNNLMIKLKLKNTVELVKFALNNGLADS